MSGFLRTLDRVWRPPPNKRQARAASRLYNVAATPKARGRRLLKRWLSAKQLMQFEAFGFFEVVGCHTLKRYRIHYAPAANVEELDEAGDPVWRLCFVPQGHLVPGDVMLAQKIALENDETAALGLANRLATSGNSEPFLWHPSC
jgi:hypothetical protein